MDELDPDPAKRPMLFPDPVDRGLHEGRRSRSNPRAVEAHALGAVQLLIAMAEFHEEGRKARLKKKDGVSRD
jgi:hypothetical protein